MQNLEKDVSAKIKQAKDTVWGTIKGKKPDDGMKLKDTYTFWAEDALMKERNKIEDARYEDETAYNRAWAEDERNYNRALQERLFEREDTAITRQAEEAVRCRTEVPGQGA